MSDGQRSGRSTGRVMSYYYYYYLCCRIGLKIKKKLKVNGNRVKECLRQHAVTLAFTHTPQTDGQPESIMLLPAPPIGWMEV